MCNSLYILYMSYILSVCEYSLILLELKGQLNDTIHVLLDYQGQTFNTILSSNMDM